MNKIMMVLGWAHGCRWPVTRSLTDAFTIHLAAGGGIASSG
jgi:hypothetical protein